MNQLIIFLIGLAFLLFFSYRDLKYSKIENNLIIIYLIVAVIVMMFAQNYIIQFIMMIFWVMFAGLMWKLNNIGGADLKILIINSIYLSLIVPNVIAGHFMFIMLLGFHGLLYGIFAKIIKTKRQIPFLPIITLTYIINYIFWIL